MSRATAARIDLAALRHNLDEVRRRAPGTRVFAVLKADAYGHGLAYAARALAHADAFAVASIEEALVVRETCGHKHPILLLEGVFSAAELTVAAHHRLDTVVHISEQVAMLASVRPPAPIGVWLKIDTGMHRLGFHPTEARAAWERLQCNAALRTPLGLITHLATADLRGDQRTPEQLRIFSRATEGMDGVRSVANSAGVLGWPASHADWVRPGIMLYGVSPFAESHGVAEGLKPVMTLSTRLIAVKCVSRGEGVGYGATWTAPADSILGIAAIGYGDGYPRHAVNGTPVLVNGRRARLVGRVSMDMITIDLSRQPDAQVGDPVVLWGEGLPVEEVASAANTIGYELLCGVAERVKFSYVGAGEPPANAPS